MVQYVIRGFAQGALLEDRAGTALRFFRNGELEILDRLTADKPCLQVLQERLARLG